MRASCSSPAWVGAVAAAALGCGSVYCAALEQVGYEKRHLLARRVESGRDAQRDAQEQFQTTLDRFKALTGFDGGALERCEGRAGEVRERIAGIRAVAKALFDEWESEIDGNARAIAMIEGNVAGIERDVDALVRAMQDAIAEADRLVAAVQD